MPACITAPNEHIVHYNFVLRLMGATELKIDIDEVHLQITEFWVWRLGLKSRECNSIIIYIEHTTNLSHNVYMSIP